MAQDDEDTTRNAPFDNSKSSPPGTPSRNSTNKGVEQRGFSDATDFYAKKGNNYIQFTSVISGESIKFKAFLTAYEDQFSSEWNSEQVYGRNDPIQTFRNTTRKISIGWDTPAASRYEAQANAQAAAKLIRMLYPSYKSTGNVATINKAPLIKVKFRNLISDYNVKSGDLLVALDGVNFSPDMEAGWFERLPSSISDASSVTTGKVDELIPKLLRFSCTMTVLHRNTIGHHGAKWPERLKNFPNLPDWPDITTAGQFDSGWTNPQVEADIAEALAEEQEAAIAAAIQEQEDFMNDLDAAIDDLDGLDTSEQVNKRAGRKQERQDRKAQKKQEKIQAQQQASEGYALMDRDLEAEQRAHDAGKHNLYDK